MDEIHDLKEGQEVSKALYKLEKQYRGVDGVAKSLLSDPKVGQLRCLTFLRMGFKEHQKIYRVELRGMGPTNRKKEKSEVFGNLCWRISRREFSKYLS